MTRIENKWIPRIPFYSPRSVFSRDIRGRDPSYIFIRRSVISLGKIRHGLVIRNEKKPAEKGRRQQKRKERKRRGAEDPDREESSLHDIGTVVVWLHNPLTWSDSGGARVNLLPRILGGKWARKMEEARTESEMGGGKKKGRLWHRNKLTYFLVAAYPCSENEQSCRIRILNRSLVVSRIESRSW